MKQINFFHWYNGQSPLAYCCMQIHPEQFWGNVKGVCICGRTERPRWVIEARRKAESLDEEALEEYLIQEFDDIIDYCKCGHSAFRHVSPPNTGWEKMVNGDIRFKCERCECVNFR